MTARPGKTLPSVIVGGLLAVGLGLGMGTAHADDGDSCTIDVAGIPVTGEESGSNCVDLVTRALLGPLRAVTPPVEVSDVEPTTTAARATTTTTPEKPNNDTLPESDVVTDGGGGRPPAGPAYIPPPPPRPMVVAAPPAGGLLTPAGFGGAPGGLMTGLPGGAAGFGAYNPGLLLAPLGSPLRTMTGQDGGSPVTTASQVQSMAFDDLPGGPGVPAVVGVLILSTLGAFALRHRVLARARAAADADAALGAAATQETATV